MKGIQIPGTIVLMVVLPLWLSCSNQSAKTAAMNPEPQAIKTIDTAVFGMGCFWCTEAVFSQLDGVISVTSGYSGGKTPNPTYREVCSGNTGHAEVTRIVFDTTRISFQELLEVFFTAHDPTTLNRQGADIGTQYRSVIFFRTEEQATLARQMISRLNEEKAFPDPIITEISPLREFYEAEDYHLDYYERNGNAPYCRMVIAPKVEKVRKVFKEKLKQ